VSQNGQVRVLTVFPVIEGQCLRGRALAYQVHDSDSAASCYPYRCKTKAELSSIGPAVFLLDIGDTVWPFAALRAVESAQFECLRLDLPLILISNRFSIHHAMDITVANDLVVETISFSPRWSIQ
jgi:hypothetical protein